MHSVEKEEVVVLDTMKVSLVGGSGSHEGDVHIGGFPVCDDGWDSRDAEVVCHQLGFPGLHTYTRLSRFTESSETPFIATSFKCEGNETGLFECSREEGAVRCEHSETAGVVCSGEHLKKFPNKITTFPRA